MMKYGNRWMRAVYKRPLHFLGPTGKQAPFLLRKHSARDALQLDDSSPGPSRTSSGLISTVAQFIGDVALLHDQDWAPSSSGAMSPTRSIAPRNPPTDDPSALQVHRDGSAAAVQPSAPVWPSARLPHRQTGVGGAMGALKQGSILRQARSMPPPRSRLAHLRNSRLGRLSPIYSNPERMSAVSEESVKEEIEVDNDAGPSCSQSAHASNAAGDDVIGSCGLSQDGRALVTAISLESQSGEDLLKAEEGKSDSGNSKEAAKGKSWWFWG